MHGLHESKWEMKLLDVKWEITELLMKDNDDLGSLGGKEFQSRGSRLKAAFHFLKET